MILRASRSAPENNCEPSYERLKVQINVKKFKKSKKRQKIEHTILILRASRSAPENNCEPSYERLKVQKNVKKTSMYKILVKDVYKNLVKIV